MKLPRNTTNVVLMSPRFVVTSVLPITVSSKFGKFPSKKFALDILSLKISTVPKITKFFDTTTSLFRNTVSYILL